MNETRERSCGFDQLPTWVNVLRADPVCTNSVFYLGPKPDNLEKGLLPSHDVYVHSILNGE
jgi:hypothetical protein